MKPARPEPPRPSIAVRFRSEIDQAVTDGVLRDDMALHLTRGDVELLKRDRNVPLADINFAGGTMTYLGVKVLKGDVTLSILHRQVADKV
jgi:hypothetical protein